MKIWSWLHMSRQLKDISEPICHEFGRDTIIEFNLIEMNERRLGTNIPRRY